MSFSGGFVEVWRDYLYSGECLNLFSIVRLYTLIEGKRALRRARASATCSAGAKARVISVAVYEPNG